MTELRVGKVTSTDYSEKTARVLFEDLDNVLSNDLKVLYQNSFWMPDIDDIVLCVFLETGTETGFVIARVG